jgi:hypothetical protein
MNPPSDAPKIKVSDEPFGCTMGCLGLVGGLVIRGYIAALFGELGYPFGASLAAWGWQRMEFVFFILPNLVLVVALSIFACVSRPRWRHGIIMFIIGLLTAEALWWGFCMKDPPSIHGD